MTGKRPRFNVLPCRDAPSDRQYITEFLGGVDGREIAEDRAERQQAARVGIIEALPDRPDPAMLGGIQPVAREALLVQGIKRDDLHKRLKQASEDEDGPIYRRRSPSPRWRSGRRASSRSRSRGRRSRHSISPFARRRAASRSLTPPHHTSQHVNSRSRSRSRDRYRSRADRRHNSRSRSRDRQRGRDGGSRLKDSSQDRRRSGGDEKYGSSTGYGSAALSSAKRERGTSAGSSRAGAVGGGGGSASATVGSGSASIKETPQERLKRLMQAQLNKAAQKDTLANAHKKIQLEKEKVARQQLERAAMSAGRGRDRSLSPEGGRSPGR